jgi:hypothetical protein
MFKQENAEPKNDEPPNVDAATSAAFIDVSSGEEKSIGRVLAMPNKKADSQSKPKQFDKFKTILVAKEGVKISDTKLNELLSMAEYTNEDPVNGCTIGEGMVSVQIIESDDGDPVPYGKEKYSVMGYRWTNGINPEGYPSSIASVVWASDWKLDKEMSKIKDERKRKEAQAQYAAALAECGDGEEG